MNIILPIYPPPTVLLLPGRGILVTETPLHSKILIMFILPSIWNLLLSALLSAHQITVPIPYATPSIRATTQPSAMHSSVFISTHWSIVLTATSLMIYLFPQVILQAGCGTSATERHQHSKIRLTIFLPPVLLQYALQLLLLKIVHHLYVHQLLLEIHAT